MVDRLLKFDAVVISGGASKGLLALGALHYEYEKKRYDPVLCNIYAGASIGSVICLLLVCGYTPIEIFLEIYTSTDLFVHNPDSTMKGMYENMGLVSIDGLIQRVSKMVEIKLGFIPTLKDLRNKSGKTLVVVVSNVSRVKCEYYTHQTHGDVSCITAIGYSSNLPFMFYRAMNNGECLTDGSIMDNLPVQYIDDGKRRILIVVTSGSSFSWADDKFAGYAMRLIYMPLVASTRFKCSILGKNTHLINIYWNREETITQFFSVPSNQKMHMFLHGYESAEIKDREIHLFVKGMENILYHDITAV